MKYILLIIFFLAGLQSFSQTINPALGTVSNKSYSPAQAIPTDYRSRFDDQTNFIMRDFQSLSEVRTYLNLAKYRTGNFPIFVHVGGTLNGNGTYTGGVTVPYWFNNGTADGNLVPMFPVTSVNSRTGDVISLIADTLKGYPIDTALRRNGYALTFDSVNHKWVLAPNGASAYVPGTGIDITGQTISALNTSAIWNANTLRGRSITTNAPNNGQLVYWDGTAFNFRDTTIGNPGTGTVTNVASGYGLVGGPITTIGTLQVDTTTISGLYLRRRDSSLYYTKYDADTSRTNIYTAIGNVAAGGITQLTGDGLAGPGAGSQVFTLSTVNTNVGSFTKANITVDGKGRIIAASNGSVSTPTLQQVMNAGDTTTREYIADTTMTVTLGSPKVKDWFLFQPLDKAHEAGVPFLISQGSNAYNTGRSDEVMYMGWNINGGGGAEVTGKSAIGIGMESHYEPFAGSDSSSEMHFVWIKPNGVVKRLGSYTALMGTGNVDFYHTISSFGIKAPSNDSLYFTLGGDGNSGNSPTIMTMFNDTGFFKITQNLDKSIILSNNYASGNRSIQMTSGWDQIQMPGTLFDQTFTTLNQPVTANSGIMINGGLFSANQSNLFETSVGGLVITGGGGSVYDLTLSNKSGADVFGIPTGTNNAFFTNRVEVGGQLKIDTTTTGVNSDSVLVINAGVVKKVSRAALIDSIKFSNGLTKTGDTVKIGGTLTANTTLNLMGKDLLITGSGRFISNAETTIDTTLVVEGTAYHNGYTYCSNPLFLTGTPLIAQLAPSYDLWNMQPYSDSSFVMQLPISGKYLKWDKLGRWNFNSIGPTSTSSVTYTFNGTDAMKIPLGTTAQRPTGASGYIRVNTDSTNAPEYYDGTNWQRLATNSYVNTSTAVGVVPLDSISDMQAYTGPSYDIYVEAEVDGGRFHLYNGPLPVNDSTIYQGAGSRVWQRDINLIEIDYSVVNTLTKADTILTLAVGQFVKRPAAPLAFLANDQTLSGRNTFTDFLDIQDSIRLGTVPTGGGSDSVLVKKADGGIYKIAQSSLGGAVSIGTLIGSGTAGSALYLGTGGALRQSNSAYFYDSTNVRLGIGTNSPDYPLQVEKTVTGDVLINATNLSTAGGAVFAGFRSDNSTSYGQMFKTGINYSTYKTISAGDFGIFNGIAGNMTFLNDVASGAIYFTAGANTTPHLAIASSGKIGIGTTAPDSTLHIVGSFYNTGGVRMSGLPSGVGTKAIRYNPSTGTLSYADTTTGGGTTYTFSTGLTNTSSTITNNLSTGVSGGQSVIGGTASGNNLTLSSTTNGTKGKIILGSTSAYDEVNDRLGIGTTSPGNPLQVSKTFANTAVVDGIRSDITSNNTSGSPTILRSIVGGLTISSSNTQAIPLVYPTISSFTYNNGGAGTVTEVVNMLSDATMASTATITNYTGFLDRIYKSSGTITNRRGFLGDNLGAGTNNTGIHLVAGNSTSGYPAIPSGNWGIYDATGYNSYFNGSIGIKTTSPTALLHLAAGTATANTAPLKFTSGTNLTTAEAGAMEWDGSNLFVTQTSGTTRKTIAYTTDPFVPLQALGSTIIGESIGTSMASITANIALNDNQVRYVAVYLPQATTITGVKWYMATQGSYTADQNNYIALYSYSGGTMTQVAISANDGNLWKATANTFVATNFATPYAAAAGVYYVGMLYNSSAQTTAPAVGNATSSTTNVNAFDFTNSAKLNSTLSGQNTMPSPQAQSGTTISSGRTWAGLY